MVSLITAPHSSPMTRSCSLVLNLEFVSLLGKQAHFFLPRFTLRISAEGSPQRGSGLGSYSGI